MWSISKLCCLGILIILSLIDIRLRKVPVRILAISGVSVVVYHLIVHEMNPWLIVGGIAVGIMFLLISKVTEESMGYGDSVGILILGFYLGLWQLVEVLLGAFFLLTLVAIFILCIAKLSRRCTLPFFPFLTGGYILSVLVGGGML